MIFQDFNKGWSLTHGVSSLIESLFGVAGKTEPVAIPNDSLISCPRSEDAKEGAAMAYFNGDNCEYTKSFTVPSCEKNKVHYLRFDGIFQNTVISINGRIVASHDYGYTPFTLRIDRYLNYDTPNALKVRVLASAAPSARWYPGIGIYRDTFLLTADKLHIPADGVRVTTLECDQELGVVAIETELRNSSDEAKSGYLHCCFRDADGNEAAKTCSKFYIDENAEIKIRQRLDVDNPKLWTAETPDLYTCECSVVVGDETLDTSVVSFGIRKLTLDSRHGLRVNGETVKLRGGCVHHDNGMLGAVSVLDAEMRKVRLMKEGGYNAIRTAHNPPSAALLEACDRLGMYVMDEFTDVWVESKATYDYAKSFAHTWEQTLTDYIRRDYNHPSIVLWSIGNEIPELGDPVSNTWGRRIFEKVKSLDTTRPVTNGVNVMVSCMGHIGEIMAEVKGIDQVSGGINDMMTDSMDVMQKLVFSDAANRLVEEGVDMLDLVGYNYSADLYEMQHNKHPERVFFGSETKPQELDYNWPIVMSKPYVVGDFCWTGWDYLGEVGIGGIERKEDAKPGFMRSYPWIASYDADFDLTGNRRTVSYWRDTIWTGREHAPYIGVYRPKNYGYELSVGGWAFTDTVHNWTWPGFEGKPVEIEVYSDAEELELLVNGASLGKQKVGNKEHTHLAKWETTYQPGELTAISYIGGKEVGRQVLKTVTAPVLTVRADKTELRAGSNDLSYVEIELRDKEGNPDMSDTRKVNVTVSGAVLAGCGSADPMTTETYQASEHKFYEGRVLAIVRAGEEKGKAAVTISSEGMEDVVVELNII